MVIILNKSNRPIGIAGQSVLPDKEIKVQDKHAYCDVYDEDGVATGERQLLPGLVALQLRGHIVITEEKKEKPVEEKAEEPAEDKPKTKKTRKSKEEKAE